MLGIVHFNLYLFVISLQSRWYNYYILKSTSRSILHIKITSSSYYVFFFFSMMYLNIEQHNYLLNYHFMYESCSKIKFWSFTNTLNMLDILLAFSSFYEDKSLNFFNGRGRRQIIFSSIHHTQPNLPTEWHRGRVATFRAVQVRFWPLISTEPCNICAWY